MEKSDKKNLQMDFSKLTLAQNKVNTNSQNNMNKNDEFKPENYVGEIKFEDDPKYYNFFISQDHSTVVLVSTNLDSKADGSFEVDYISDEDLRFEAIIGLIENNSRSEKNSSAFNIFLDIETGIQLEYRFLAHDGFKRRTVNSILENINMPSINEGNMDEK